MIEMHTPDSQAVSARGIARTWPSGAAGLVVLTVVTLTAFVLGAVLYSQSQDPVPPAVPATAILGDAESLLQELQATQVPLQDRARWGPGLAVIQVDPSAPGFADIYEPAATARLDATHGLMVVDLRDPHRGFIVAWCNTFRGYQSFEHGSLFNSRGEYLAGPAPGGLRRYPASINSGGQLVVDLTRLIPGPNRGEFSTPSDPVTDSCPPRQAQASEPS